MDYEGVLKQVLSDIQSAKVPDEMQNFAFEEGVRFYLRGAPKAAQGTQPAAGPASSPEGSNEVSSRPKVGDLLGRVAAETGTDKVAVEYVFYVDAAGEAQFNLSGRLLGKSKSDRIKTIALLVASVRHFGLDETEVPLETIRAACIALNTYDQSNFASYMRGVPGFTLSGPASQRVFRAKADAASKFLEKVAELAKAGG